MKNILVIGAGRFGRYSAQKLHELGHDVMVVDLREDRQDYEPVAEAAVSRSGLSSVTEYYVTFEKKNTFILCLPILKFVIIFIICNSTDETLFNIILFFILSL